MENNTTIIKREKNRRKKKWPLDADNGFLSYTKMRKIHEELHVRKVVSDPNFYDEKTGKIGE